MSNNPIRKGSKKTVNTPEKPHKPAPELDNSIFDEVPNLPEEVRRELQQMPASMRQAVMLSLRVTSTYTHNQWPTQEQLQALDEVYPGEAKRILDLAHDRARHDMAMEDREMGLRETQTKNIGIHTSTGQRNFILMFFGLIGVLVFAVCLAPSIAGVVASVLVAGFGCLAAYFTFRRQTPIKEKDQKSKS